jgi:hypothetical protein
MSSPARHAHDQLRADLVEWCLGAAVALREQPDAPQEIRAQVLRNLRVARCFLDHWDDEPRNREFEPV